MRKRRQCVCVRSLVSLLLFLFRNIPGQKCELVGFEAYIFGKAYSSRSVHTRFGSF